MSDTLLSYALFTNPDPLQVSASPATLTLVVSNGGRNPVTVSKIVVTLPIGTNASDLAANGRGIRVSRPEKWSATNDNNGVITFTPEPSVAVIGGAGVTFTFAGIAVNAQPGLCTVMIDETATVTPPNASERSTTIDLAKMPAQFFVSDLNVFPPDVPYNGSATLTWNGTADATYTLQYRPDDGGAVVKKPVGNEGPYVASNLTRESVSFTLEVSVALPGHDRPLIVQRQKTVQVARLKLEVSGEPLVVGANGLVHLQWSAPNATGCVLEPGTKSLPPAGDLWTTIPKTEHFTVTAKGAAGAQVQRQLTVSVDPAIVPNIAGKTAKGADGGPGSPARDLIGLPPQRGGRGGDGGDATISGALPPLDTSSRPARVMPISATAGNGGAGGRGGDSQQVGMSTERGGPGGDGGRGGNARIDVTLDPAAGAPAQYVVQLQAGRRPAGGQGGWGGFGEGATGTNGANGTAVIAVRPKVAAMAVATDDQQPLLQYALLTSPDPLAASATSATLTLVVSNGQRDVVHCTEIDVTLPVGTSAQTLTPDSTGIEVLPSSGWTSSPQGGGTYSLTPNTAADGKIGAAGLVFTFARVRINDQPGTAAISIAETAAMGGATPVERDATLNVSKFPQQFFLSQLLAHPTEVAYGGETILMWSGTGDATYALIYDPGSGSLRVPVTNSGPFPAGGLIAQTVFTLEASVPVAGQDHPLVVQRQTTVAIQPQLAITSFMTSATALAAGQPLTLAWRTTLAEGCAIGVAGLPGSVEVSSYGGCVVSSPHGDALVFTTTDGATILGTIAVPASATSLIFILTATGGGASVESELRVQLLLVRIGQLEVFKFRHMAATAVRWATDNTVDCRITGPGVDRAVGQRGFISFPDVTFAPYTLHCRGFGGPQDDTHAPQRPFRRALAAAEDDDGDGTLLDYALLTQPDPLQASAQNAILTLVVSNSGRDPVQCSSIMVTLPVGTGGSSLTADATGVETQLPDGWSVTNDGGTITFTPSGSSAVTIGDQPVTFLFSRITVNDNAGTCTITIDETASTSEQPSEDRTLDLTVAKFPPQFQVSDLTAEPLDVPAGATATLQWTGSAGATYTYTMQYQPADAGTPVSASVGNTGPYVSQPLTRANSVTFTLIVAVVVPGLDQPLILQRQRTVTVETLTLEFDVEPPTVGVNGLVQLHWNANNAASCQLSPGPAIGTSGEFFVVLQTTTVFTLTANGAAGSLQQKQLTVTVDPTIVPNVTGYQVIGAAGARGDDSGDGDGGTGGDGGDAILNVTLPPLDTGGSNALVMPITVVGGSGGGGGNGGIDFEPYPPYSGNGGSGGTGGQGGDATLNATLSASAGAPTQYIVVLRGGSGGNGGQGGGQGGYPNVQPGGNGSPGSNGIVTLLIDGSP